MNWRYFLLIVFFLHKQEGFSQNKYALLIGINEYQKKNKDGSVGIDTANTLKGCVNDAKSIKELIVNRFGFQKSNIRELYNFKATKKNILAAINSLLLKCKPGDVAIVYYAGHGSTFRYGENATQTAEYILPSDGFSNYRRLSTGTNENSYEYSFIQTSLLASLFNKFVDKKVVLTALFDCCNSKGTIGVKKTISTSKLINGIPKIMNYTFWENAVEMSTATPFPKRRKGIIGYPAADQELKNNCNDVEIQEAVTKWLSSNGYASVNEEFSCVDSVVRKNDTVFWTNNFNSGNWEKLCGKTKQMRVLFTAKDSCNHTDTTSATFIITDNEKPKIYEPAKNITVKSSKDSAVKKWLSLNGGALASDGCSDSITWTNNFDSTLNAYFNVSGSALVTFTAKDACDNSDFVRAIITVADDYNPVDYRLTAQESAAIITLLNNLDAIRENAKRFGYYNQSPTLRDMIMKQLDTIAAIKIIVSKKSKDTQTGNFDAIQATPLMTALVEQTDFLMFLLSQIPYREEDQLTDNMVVVVPSDSITDNNTDVSRNANNIKVVLPDGFSYKEYEFKPPSLMPESRFVFMSATDDVQLAKERKINNVSHGVFTAALIEVFKSSSPAAKITDVFERVKQQLKQWKVVQTPTLRVAEKRKHKNLFGF